MTEAPKVQSSDLDFQLHTLGWKAFQDMCLTVVTEILGQSVQRFLNSRDGGRDGAFTGDWNPRIGPGGVSGSFTIQCKFSGQAGAVLRLADLREELEKATRLGAAGLAENYLLITNCGVSGRLDEAIRARLLAIPGIKHAATFGQGWLTQHIRDSARLRLLVPRVYGLGDLAQILDSRAYEQARELLASMREELATFVVTGAYNLSVTAIVSHGFVLLLGQPASGKTTIAAHLALGAIDQWGARTIRLTHPDEFLAHRNPSEPKQFFWVDDAFGVTQYQRETANAWNRLLPSMAAAIRSGARILLTSRDYIYRAAMRDLKIAAFPLLRESQVVIEVERLTLDEKERILYNHIKLGDQPRRFRSAVKHLLPAVSRNPYFMPEIARRLGNQRFTGDLALTAKGLEEFTEKPVGFLADTLRSLDRECLAALGVIFMGGGRLASPLELDAAFTSALRTMGGTEVGLRSALAALEGSLVKRQERDGRGWWTFKHPTIGEAIALIFRDDVELLDVYLTGTPMEKLMQEVSCGTVALEGVRVLVPATRYLEFARRLRDVKGVASLHYFLAQRCAREFLEIAMAEMPWVLSPPDLPSSAALAPARLALAARLRDVRLLPEQVRVEIARAIREQTIDEADASVFASPDMKLLLTPSEYGVLREEVRSEFIPNLRAVIDAWEDSRPSDEAPGDFFEPIIATMRSLTKEYDGDTPALEGLLSAASHLQRIIDEALEANSADHEEPEYYDDEYGGRTAPAGERSMFDDLDD